ncbi:hypothetical protein [Aliikangiella coralliicola]|uniref:CheW-like domain-containing protein n=1 Tax=Aliikangiella coralliicola TaxID=2592383 RepID=A0A545UHX6_9GAMM|nr:hypothetical protein [Aliikangiella coralliicola]TQV89070.1 hypothetical protein FLL46_05955 [Aliikangiella coralliicola]
MSSFAQASQPVGSFLKPAQPSTLSSQKTYCLLRWDQCRVAIAANNIESIQLDESFIHSSHKDAKENPIQLLCLNSQLTNEQQVDPTRKRIAILQLMRKKIGLYCHEISFTESNQPCDSQSIPLAMQTEQFPINGILRYEKTDYFFIDPEKLLKHL